MEIAIVYTGVPARMRNRIHAAIDSITNGKLIRGSYMSLPKLKAARKPKKGSK